MDENYKNFLILRPLINGMEETENKMPIIKKVTINEEDYAKIKVTNFKNLNSIIDKSNTIVDMFNYDYVLNSIWNNPLKYIAKFDGLYAISSPDFSVYPNMNKYEIVHNVFKSRWIGALWQVLGYKIIPTLSWAGEDTYDICFSGVEYGTVVIISTLGVSKNKEMFLRGFFEMKKRINPSLIIVIGVIFEEMEGNFLSFALIDTFNPRKNVEQLSLFENHHITKTVEAIIYGW